MKKPEPIKDPKATNQKTVNNKPVVKGKETEIIEEPKPTLPESRQFTKIDPIVERFIYITTYNDSELMKSLKEIFEIVNTKAFNLKSVKEVYTKNLNNDEQNNLNIDYISGVQIIDINYRITIIEGITGKSMKYVKERLPKQDVNK